MARLRRRKPPSARWLALLYIACLIGSIGIGIFLAGYFRDPIPSGGVLPVLSGILIEGETKIQNQIKQMLDTFHHGR